MAMDEEGTRGHLRRIADLIGSDAVPERLDPDFSSLPERIPGGARCDAASMASRWEVVPHTAQVRETLTAGASNPEAFESHIENFIGTVQVPIGLAGPLRVRGVFAQGDFYVPLATTEAALVASYGRGARVISEAGGSSAAVLSEGVGRSPCYAFRDLAAAGAFVAWVTENREVLQQVAEETTRHGLLRDMGFTVEGNHVYLHLNFLTGDAAGQNMVTIATQALHEHILAHCPIDPEHAFVESNMSGDKKASTQAFQSVRGRKVCAEIHVPRTLVEKRLHTTPEQMEKYWQMSALGGVMSGTIGVQGHYANGLAALYLATGQDVACVSESAVGVTRLESRDDALYASVTLPNVVVGTVGGGTSLPWQAACLDLLGLRGAGKANALAEIAAALVLGGELSLIAALCAGDFTKAHRKLARKPRSTPSPPSKA